MISTEEKKQIGEISDYVKYLSLLAVEKAKSGHPGMPLGMASAGALLYLKYLNRGEPGWINRDRLILSAGHGSMFLYALEYIFGNFFSIKDIAAFRQFNSKTPGHPELDMHAGIDTSTGPLGQGFANAVGAALQGKMLSAEFPDSPDLFDYATYVIAGDGCMMEGVTYEAASVAGHLKLDNLTAIYDSNSITIDGSTSIAFSENTAARFESQGWHVEKSDSADIRSLDAALEKTGKITGKPKLIIHSTIIGDGLSKISNSSKCHGAPAGTDEIAAFIENSSLARFFETILHASGKEKIKAALEEQIKSGSFIRKEDFLSRACTFSMEKQNSWKKKFTTAAAKNPSLNSLSADKDLAGIEAVMEKLFSFESKPGASRDIFSDIIQQIAPLVRGIVCSSADLAGSTKVKINSSDFISSVNFAAKNIAFGIREHAMGSILNGLILDGKYTAMSSTFQVFSDYMRPAIRMAALMKLKQLFVFTHDSYMVGEDGPTHQPVEHIQTLRVIPDLVVMRPANDSEAAFSLAYFLENEGPAALLLSRQNLENEAFKILPRGRDGFDLFKKGIYRILKLGISKNVCIISSGYELSTSLKAAQILHSSGSDCEVYSMPSFEITQKLNPGFINKELIPSFKKVVFFEPFSMKIFRNFAPSNVLFIGQDDFGKSSNAADLTKHFGFSPESVATSIDRFAGK